MKLLKLLTMSGIFLVAPAYVAAESIKGYLCNNCTLQQAEGVAKAYGAPELKCSPAGNNEYITADEHICYSSQQKFIIFDAIAEMAYPFQVTHNNQGSLSRKMRPAVQMVSLTTKESLIVDDFFKMLVLQEQTLQEYALTASENLSATFLALAAGYNSLSESCESDSSATVLKTTLNSAYKNNISNAVNLQLRQSNTRDYKAGFEVARFNQFGFDAKKDGIGLSVGWQYVPKAKLAHKNIYEPGQQVLPNGTPYFPARAAYTLSWDDRLDTIRVEVEKSLTRVTEHLTLADILEDSNWNMELSACALRELEKYFTSSDAIPEDGGGNNGGESGEEMVISLLNPSQQQCKWHFYNKEERLVATVMGPCP